MQKLEDTNSSFKLARMGIGGMIFFLSFVPIPCD